jgi:hypothetical protein
MRLARFGVLLAMVTALAAPVASAHADGDTDFANQLHGDGIYGPRDYNAWIGKITCERLSNGIDVSAAKSAEFVSSNLARGATTAQTWQFLAAAISAYCPDRQPILASAAQLGR